MRGRYSFKNQFAAVLTAAAMILPGIARGSETAMTEQPVRSMTDDQKIVHVLDRLGFGARPGDVAKVRAMGLKKYIDRQMDPSSIDDSAAEAKVKGIEIFNMSTAEVFAKYPNPGALLRELDGNKKGQAAAVQTPAANDQTADADRKARQAELREYYKKYDLRPASTLVPQIVANRLLRAVYSERQLQEVMVDFWQNHFNVYSGKAAVRWYIPSYERDVLRKNALGNFRDLLAGTAEHPAMLFFLDNFESVSPQAKQGGGNTALIERIERNGGTLSPMARERMKDRLGINDQQLDQRLQQIRTRAENAKKAPKRGINENYARELMELHTLGVDGGYTQKDIIEVAKCFTGWTIADPRGYRKAAANDIKGVDDSKRLARIQKIAGVPDDLESGQFYFNPNWHEPGPKMVLGQKIDEGGIKDGLKVIDILVNSPATAKFIARKLAVKFVSDTPSDELVTRVADAFHNSKGDIKTTLRAIFTSPEFYAPETYRAKIKTPFELAASSIRAIGADTNGGPSMLAMLNKLGEVPYGYQAPTGYPDKADDWVNTGALLERLNFAVAVASNRIPGTRVDLRGFDAADKQKTLDKAIDEILNGDISSATRASLQKQLEQPLPDVKPPNEPDDDTVASNTLDNARLPRRAARLLNPSGDPNIFKAVSLVLGSPEFQRQ